MPSRRFTRPVTHTRSRPSLRSRSQRPRRRHAGDISVGPKAGCGRHPASANKTPIFWSQIVRKNQTRSSIWLPIPAPVPTTDHFARFAASGALRLCPSLSATLQADSPWPFVATAVACIGVNANTTGAGNANVAVNIASIANPHDDSLHCFRTWSKLALTSGAPPVTVQANCRPSPTHAHSARSREAAREPLVASCPVERADHKGC
jgi:hypothetical protein